VNWEVPRGAYNDIWIISRSSVEKCKGVDGCDGEVCILLSISNCLEHTLRSAEQLLVYDRKVERNEEKGT